MSVNLLAMLLLLMMLAFLSPLLLPLLLLFSCMLLTARLWLRTFGASCCSYVKQPASKGSLLSTLDVV